MENDEKRKLDFIKTINFGLKSRQDPLNVDHPISYVLVEDDGSIIVGFENSLIKRYKKKNQVSENSNCHVGAIKGILKVDEDILVFGYDPHIVFLDKKLTQIDLINEEFNVIDVAYDNYIQYLITVRETQSPNESIVTIRNKKEKLIESVIHQISLKYKAIKILIYRSFLFILNDLGVEKWNISNQIKDSFISLPKVSSIVCSHKAYFAIIYDNLYRIPVDDPTTKHNLLEKVTEVKISADEKFLYTIGFYLCILDASTYEKIGYSTLTATPIYISLKFNTLCIAYKKSFTTIPCQEDLDKIILAETESEIIKFEIFNDTSLYIAEKNNRICRYDVESSMLPYSELNKIEYYEDTISCIRICEKFQELAVGNDESTIKLYRLPELTLKETLTSHKLPVVGLAYCDGSLVSIASSENNMEVIIWSTEEPRSIKKIIVNPGKVHSIASNSTDYIVFNTKFFVFLYEDGINIGDLNGKLLPQKCNLKEILHVSCNDKYLVVVDNSITVWEMNTISKLQILSYSGLEQILQIKSSELIEDFFVIATTNIFHIFSISNKIYIGGIRIPEKIHRINYYKERIYFSSQKEVISIKNIFSSTELFLVGPAVPSLGFSLYFNLQFSEITEVPAHIYKWVVLPECINIMHLFAYHSSHLMIKKAFKGECIFIKSINNISPLTISLIKENKELNEYIIKKVSRISRNTPYIMTVIEDDLSKINKSGVSTISDLYMEAFITPAQQDLPNYGKLKGTNVIKIAFGYFIDYNNFLVKDNALNEEYVTFLTSTIRLDFDKGSEDSTNFLNSLIQCNDSDVFSTPLIKNYLMYKWSSAMVIIMPHMLLYSTLLIVLTFDTLYNGWWLYSAILLIINSGDIIYEIIQMTYNVKDYFKSKTNWFDILRIIFLYVYIFKDFLEDSNNDFIKRIGTFILFISYLRGMLYFKMFKKTRYMIKMMEEIFLDTIHFGIIFIYLLMAFTTFFHFTRESPKSFMATFSDVYSMAYGQYDPDDYNNTEWICVYMISFGIPLVAINLLIAIMGNSYQRVHEGMTQTDLKAMTQLILETEIVFSYFFTRNPIKMYLQKCEIGSEASKDITERLNYKIQSCNKDLNSILLQFGSLEKTNPYTGFLKTIRNTRDSKIKTLASIRDNLISEKRKIIEESIKK
jgi:hypothetical protein